MPLDHGVLTHRVPQNGQPGMALGRNLELDARSLAYTLKPEEVRQPIVPKEWLPKIPTLDQGNLGSCTGNAGTYHLSALLQSNQTAQKTMLDEHFAIGLYHLATVADGFPGTYPPDDTGSSGLGVCRALKKQRLIAGYRWALSARAWGMLLQTGGTIIGMPWLNAFFHPDAHGFIDADPNWQQSGIAGGHEAYVEALEAWDDADISKCIVRFHNSWSDSWGDHGCGRMRLSTYAALNGQIDVKQARLT